MLAPYIFYFSPHTFQLESSSTFYTQHPKNQKIKIKIKIKSSPTLFPTTHSLLLVPLHRREITIASAVTPHFSGDVISPLSMSRSLPSPRRHLDHGGNQADRRDDKVEGSFGSTARKLQLQTGRGGRRHRAVELRVLSSNLSPVGGEWGDGELSGSSARRRR